MGNADLVIRNGTVVDGTGAPARQADVAIEGDRIIAVEDASNGKGYDGTGSREIDADGRIVTPGFVDIHTYLDAQVAWDPLPTSSCWHGVTSAVLGNCGVTFAPVADGGAEFLAEMMESVEDIPRRVKTPSSADDIAAMAALVDEAIGAGALGFSTSRTLLHVVPDGRQVPGTFADENELLAFGDVLARHGKGIFEAAAPPPAGSARSRPSSTSTWRPGAR